MPNPTAVHPLQDDATKVARVSFSLTTDQVALLDDACVRLGGWSRSMLIRHLSVTGARSICSSTTLGPDGVLAGLIPPAEAQDPTA